MSLVTVKRIADELGEDQDESTIKTSTKLIEFEKEFNFNNLKQIYNDSKSCDSTKQLKYDFGVEKPLTCLISLNLIEKYFVIKDAALILPRRKLNRLSARHLLFRTKSSSSTEQDDSLIDDKSLFRYQNQIEQQQNQLSTSEMNEFVATGDILTHLKAMIHLIRPTDTISVAVKLCSYHANKIRYLVIVETIAPRTDDDSYPTSNDDDDYDSCCKESAILGLDLHLNTINEDQQQLTCTVGLVMPIYANCEISLNGDGGFKFKTHHSTHIFKPVSIQAMWSSYQYLHKAFENARKRNFYSVSSASMSSLISTNSNETPNEITPSYNNHEWVKYYSSLINKTTSSSSSSSLNEWYQKEERNSQREDFTTPYFDGLKLSKEEEETGIKIKEKLKEIMISSKDDYGSMSSIYIRELLEKELELKLDSFKKFIDVTIFQFYNQLVECASQLLPYLYLGTEWNASNYDSLIADNVTHILNVSSEVDNFFPDSFKYLNIRVLDIDQTDLIKEFDRTNKFIQEAKEQSASCLVHCKMGVSRSASVCLAYLMKECDWSYEQAFSYTKQRRSCINPNDGFKSQLATYESILNAHKAKKNLFEQPTASSTSINVLTEQNSNGSTSPANRNSFETQSFPLTPSPSNELSDKELLTKISVKETINKLKSISSSEQLPVRLSTTSPPLSPPQQTKNVMFTTSTSLVLSPAVHVKRSTSHLTTQNEIRKKITENEISDENLSNNKNNENIFRPQHHQRSKSSSTYDNNDDCLINKSRQSKSWASNQFEPKQNPKLKQISSNNLLGYSSENSLNFESKQSSSSSSSSSIRSAVRNSLIFTNLEDNSSVFFSTGNVKRQVESINFKSRPCTPQNDHSDEINQTNVNKRQSILSLGESIAEVDDEVNKSNLDHIAEQVGIPYVDCSSTEPDQLFESSKQINTTSPDGKRFKYELTHQFQQPVVQPSRSKKIFEFLDKKNKQLDENSIINEKETTLT